MTIHGHVHNGVIVFDDPVTLPEGAAVQVQVVAKPSPTELDKERPTLAETLKDFIGCLEDLPEDAARNHDHYLYGAPKKP